VRYRFSASRSMPTSHRPELRRIARVWRAAHGRTGCGRGRNGGHRDGQNSKLRVTERVQPLTITFKNRIAHAIWFRCRYLAETEWRTSKGRLRPLAKLVIWPTNALTASEFSRAGPDSRAS
jgi:hypothetical protein